MKRKTVGMCLCFKRTARGMAERRLTTDLKGRPVGASIIPMHSENIKRLENAYRHPFEKIHEEYFECGEDWQRQNTFDSKKV